MAKTAFTGLKITFARDGIKMERSFPDVGVNLALELMETVNDHLSPKLPFRETELEGKTPDENGKGDSGPDPDGSAGRIQKAAKSS